MLSASKLPQFNCGLFDTRKLGLNSVQFNSDNHNFLSNVNCMLSTSKLPQFNCGLFDTRKLSLNSVQFNSDNHNFLSNVNCMLSTSKLPQFNCGLFDTRKLSLNSVQFNSDNHNFLSNVPNMSTFDKHVHVIIYLSDLGMFIYLIFPFACVIPGKFNTRTFHAVCFKPCKARLFYLFDYVVPFSFYCKE